LKICILNLEFVVDKCEKKIIDRSISFTRVTYRFIVNAYDHFYSLIHGIRFLTKKKKKNSDQTKTPITNTITVII
jgi:hypothetical protein